MAKDYFITFETVITHSKTPPMNNPSLQKLADIKHLTAAWQSILAKGTSGGIDHVSIEDYKRQWQQNLRRLSAQLLNHTWKPQPYMGVQVPKNNEGTRTLGLLSIEDKIVQQGIKFLIEPLIEPKLHGSCYAYRSGKGHTKAVRRCLHECRQAPCKVYVRLDVKDYFDTIDREILLQQLSSIVPNKDILSLVRLCISMGRVAPSLKWEESEFGIPQGAILSPLLSNLYLVTFDKFMESISCAYIRYSDDCVAWFNDSESAQAGYSAASAFLSKELRLTLNDKVKIAPIDVPMTYLGVDISPNGLGLSVEKRRELEYRIGQVEVKGGSLTPSYLKTLDGVRQYYVRVLHEEYGVLMDGWLRKAVQQYTTNNKLRMREAAVLFKPLDGFIDKEVIRQWIKQASSTEEQKRGIAKTVASRKREYQKLESENSELAITSPGYFIGLSGRGLTLRKNGQPVKMPPTAALKHISILSDGVSLSSNAIRFCTEEGINIDFFDMHTNHIATILSPKYLYTSKWRLQSSVDENLSCEIGRRIILGKVKNQFALAKYFNKYHKRVGGETAFGQYQQAVEKIIVRIKSLETGDLASFRQKIMSYEATSATVYWEYVRELIQDDIDGFYSRVKQGATDLVNSMLNYGYAILYPRIWQAALRYQLNPYMGFVHYADGNANLVFDMIELFRAQAVDRVVISLIQKKETLGVKNGKLDDSTKKKLTASVLERLNRKERYRGEMRSFVEIIDAQFRELIATMSTGNAFRPYLAKW